MKTTLLIPTLNEINGLREVMPKIKREWVDQILVVDGGSIDGSLEYLRQNNYQLIVQKAPGLRHAYIEAWEHIQGDVVITFSPDGNSVPELIPALIKKMQEGFDMVIVSRYAAGAHSYDDDRVTAFGNWMFTRLINFIYRVKYTDAMVMFRAWKKEVFKELDLDKEASYVVEEKIFFTKVGVEPLLSIRAAKKKLKCADIPGDEPPRVAGSRRKLQVLRWGAAYLAEVIRETVFWRN